MRRRFSRRGRREVALRLWLCGLMLAQSLSGCAPSFWRKQADVDAYALEAATVTDPRWAVPRLDITPAAGSRFADPHHPDCQPLPPDDAAAHDYMHCVDGWKGFPYWHENGQALTIESPIWRAPAGLNPDGFDPVTGDYVGDGAIPELSLPEAIDLALIHNRDYQFQIERVYLQALSVSFEEFRLGVRYLGFGGPPGAGLTTTVRPGPRSDVRQGELNFGISQLLPSGGQLIAELANDTLWFFSSGSGTSTASAFSYAFTQPLLAGAGRKVNLERLTQAQRDLLYTLRDLARFRRLFFTDIVATGAGDGYLGLLEQTQGIRNQIDNIRRLERQVDIERALNSQPPSRLVARLAELPDDVTIPDELAPQLRYDADLGQLIWRGRLSDDDAAALTGLSDDEAFLAAVADMVSQVQGDAFSLDVLQLESDLARSIVQLRSQERALQDSLDNYKILLGLPTDFPLGIDDELLEPFQFIAVELVSLEQELIDYVAEWAAIDDADPNPDEMRNVIAGLRDLERRINEEVVSLVGDEIAELLDTQDDRLAGLDTDADRTRVRAQTQRDERLFGNTETLLESLVSGLDQQDALLDEAEALAERADSLADPLARAVLMRQALGLRRTVRPAINDARIGLIQVTQALTAIQIGVRSDFVSVQPVEISIEEAVEVGLNNRLDLMNARAQVVDAWRQVEINQNLLKSALSITAGGDIRTDPGNDPLDFNRTQSDFRAGIQFDTPLDKLDERNDYRASQIVYQRSRRDYIESEDFVKQQIRRSWRQLEVLRRNLETAKQQVRIAALQLDVAIEEANAPAVRATRSGGGSSGLRGQNLTRALSEILRAQNSLIGIYTSYERNRLLLYRDMGVMEIGEDGVWNDPFYRTLAAGDPGDGDDTAERAARAGGEQMESLFDDGDVAGAARLPRPTLDDELDGADGADGLEELEELEELEDLSGDPLGDPLGEDLGFGPRGVDGGDLDERLIGDEASNGGADDARPLLPPVDINAPPGGPRPGSPQLRPDANRIEGTPLPPPAPTLPAPTGQATPPTPDPFADAIRTADWTPRDADGATRRLGDLATTAEPSPRRGVDPHAGPQGSPGPDERVAPIGDAIDTATAGAAREIDRSGGAAVAYDETSAAAARTATPSGHIAPYANGKRPAAAMTRPGSQPAAALPPADPTPPTAILPTAILPTAFPPSTASLPPSLTTTGPTSSLSASDDDSASDDEAARWPAAPGERPLGATADRTRHAADRHVRPVVFERGEPDERDAKRRSDGDGTGDGTGGLFDRPVDAVGPYLRGVRQAEWIGRIE